MIWKTVLNDSNLWLFEFHHKNSKNIKKRWMMISNIYQSFETKHVEWICYYRSEIPSPNLSILMEPNIILLPEIIASTSRVTTEQGHHIQQISDFILFVNLINCNFSCVYIIFILNCHCYFYSPISCIYIV